MRAGGILFPPSHSCVIDSSTGRLNPTGTGALYSQGRRASRVQLITLTPPSTIAGPRRINCGHAARAPRALYCCVGIASGRCSLMCPRSFRCTSAPASRWAILSCSAASSVGASVQSTSTTCSDQYLRSLTSSCQNSTRCCMNSKLLSSASGQQRGSCTSEQMEPYPRSRPAAVGATKPQTGDQPPRHCRNTWQRHPAEVALHRCQSVRLRTARKRRTLPLPQTISKICVSCPRWDTIRPYRY